MRDDLVQEHRCAVCGQPLALRADADREGEPWGAESEPVGSLPVCAACRDELYYGDDPDLS